MNWDLQKKEVFLGTYLPHTLLCQSWSSQSCTESASEKCQPWWFILQTLPSQIINWNKSWGDSQTGRWSWLISITSLTKFWIKLQWCCKWSQEEKGIYSDNSQLFSQGVRHWACQWSKVLHYFLHIFNPNWTLEWVI